MPCDCNDIQGYDIEIANPNIVSFWFQVRAKNNIHNQFKSGASKHTNKYLIYNIIVFTSEDTEGKYA